VLAPALGQLEAHDLVRDASARAARLHISLHAALLDDPTVARAGIGSDDLTAALDPAGYLGTAAEFVRRALAAHRAGDNNSGSSSD
jgi:3-carboxy-cis,cis-muconate cycloisomerase